MQDVAAPQRQVSVPTRLRAIPLGPALVVAVVLLLLARAEYVKQHFHSLTGFVDVSAKYGAVAGVASEAITPLGYDGQFYYYIARDPGVLVACAHNTPSCPLDSLREVRSERILYPFAVRLLALGQTGALPFTLLLINFLAILVTTLLVSMLCMAEGASKWLGAAAGLFCGETLAFLRDLADPFSVMWVVVAIYFLRKDRPQVAALAVAAALLTREQLIFYVPLLAIPLVAQRRWRELAISGAIALGPFVAWQVMLRALYGSWPLLSDSGAAALVPIPFGGLWQDRTTGDFWLVVGAVAVPMVVAVAIAVVATWRRGLSSLLRDPLPLMVVVYLGLLSLTYWFNWNDIYGPARLAAPGIVLGVLVAQEAPRLLRATYGWLLVATSAFELARNLGSLVPFLHH